MIFNKLHEINPQNQFRECAINFADFSNFIETRTAKFMDNYGTYFERIPHHLGNYLNK